ncbi:putative helicase mov-10-B.1 isoform X2 [Brienomyrus brachyistius]|uniref:putative helicase mov-10-B.1 isoform X2 n=1 Tax=Brienomyrus brachyistius TaxID=42636 RepID=UPI0020B361B6|nr:putative helicase mov-10-B.1 isoform X2 [Brienomyrus brachyistius]
MGPKFKRSLEGGLRFIDYLEGSDENWGNDKKQLKEIYNKDFRNRHEVSYPNFSSVLYALVRSRKATVRGDWVHLVVPNQRRRPYGQNQPRSAPRGRDVSQPTCSGEVVPVLLDLDQRSGYLLHDQESIKITSDDEIVDGKIEFAFCDLQTACTVKLVINNISTSLVHLTAISISQRIHCYKLTDGSKVTCPLQLNPEGIHEVWVEFQSDHYGATQATLDFEFQRDPLGSAQPFRVTRLLEANYQGPLTADLGPIAPYKPVQLPKQSDVESREVEGVKPDRSDENKLKTVAELHDYPCPKNLSELEKFLNQKRFISSGSSTFQTSKSILQRSLNFQNYSQRFKLLLHLEEHQMMKDIMKYSMENVTMTQDRNKTNLLVLDVPGLAENRPSLLRGDCILASKAENNGPLIKYRGYVHVVELNKVLLGFSEKLLRSFIINMKFNVQFTISRLLLRLQHRAVHLAVLTNLEKVLFPTGYASENVPPLSLRLIDKKLESNEKQRSAVEHIVSGSSRPAPYLVFGPPGTGKTVTLVEAIKQVGKNKSARILACAPSNSAADLLCERILGDHVERRNVYRLYASCVDPKNIPNRLLECCNFENGGFVFPSKEKLMNYNILVTTLYTAGRFVTGGFPMKHFTYIFVDEAGHATEPETIISIAGLLQAETGQVVLAGDPKQLGPIIRSSLAIKYGLGMSLLERLMSHIQLYKKNSEMQFDDRCVTKLVKNYRSHPAILKIPNELFYDGELQAHANEILRNSYCNWEHLRKRDFPIIFDGVTGKEQREQNSPSFFNVTEVEIIVKYLKKLFETQAKKGLQTLSPKDIGIIAPYRKQVQKIKRAITVTDRELSKLKDIKDLKVGSVEEFQGQERKVIMISTVRSDTNHIKMDHEFQIGFLSNEKRFNVAVTRAKALLIVVGNPIVLNKDPIWKRFIQYCTDEHGYIGVKYWESKSEVLYIGADLGDETEESAIQRYVDPPFRREE